MEISPTWQLLAVIGVLVAFMVLQMVLHHRMEKAFQVERDRWEEQRKDLLNRIMAFSETALDRYAYAETLRVEPNKEPEQWEADEMETFQIPPMDTGGTP